MNFKSLLLSGLAVASLVLVGCGAKDTDSASGQGTTGGAPNAMLKGDIKVGGSSTVYPISQAFAEEFGRANNGVKVSVDESGTTAGFQKFMDGALDIAGASRTIDEEEIAMAKEKGIEFIEVPIAYDGLSIVVNPKNTWCESLTVAELNKIWNRDSKIDNWKDVRPGFPDKALKLFGAGEASGTFDYFNEAINGDKKNYRSDYSKSEDDNNLVNGVAGEEGGLGYFGYAYYVNNTSKVKIVKVDPGTGPVEPSETTINDGSYQPLSRPIFLYINKKALERPEVMAFMKFALGTDGPLLVKDSGYIPLPKEVMDLNVQRVDKMVVGSAFVGKPMVGIKLADVLKAATGN